MRPRFVRSSFSPAGGEPPAGDGQGRARLDALISALAAGGTPLPALLAARARRVTRELRVAPAHVATVLVARGDPQEGLPRATLAALAAELQAVLGQPVDAAFVDDVPAVEDLRLDARRTDLLALPLFADGADPATADLPGRLARAAGARRVILERPLAELPECRPHLARRPPPRGG